MSPTTQGLIVLTVTLATLLSGAPVAFGLGAISILICLSTLTYSYAATARFGFELVPRHSISRRQKASN